MNSSLDERGQGHVLEAVVAAFLMLASIVFALQMTAVTPLSASTSSQHLENQLQASGSGVLASASQTGGLSEAIRYWNNGSSRFHGASEDGYYTSSPPDIFLGNALNQTYDSRNIAYNVNFLYATEGGQTKRTRFIYRGQPSDQAVQASRSVVILDSDSLIKADGSANADLNVSSADSYFLSDAASDQQVRNVVRVEVIAWRI